jgi:hypothetical protein
MSAWPGVGTEYLYEFASGSSAICTFVGWKSLIHIFRRVNEGTDFRIPAIDMGDGSLCTEYLKRI